MKRLVNAAHAIDQPGTISIHRQHRNKDNICVEISDTAKCIAPEHINRIALL